MTVFFIGFLLQANDSVATVGSIAACPETANHFTIEIDKAAWLGASGSPIFPPDGKRVIGMVTRTGIE